MFGAVVFTFLGIQTCQSLFMWLGYGSTKAVNNNYSAVCRMAIRIGYSLIRPCNTVLPFVLRQTSFQLTLTDYPPMSVKWMTKINYINNNTTYIQLTHNYKFRFGLTSTRKLSMPLMRQWPVRSLFCLLCDASKETRQNKISREKRNCFEMFCNQTLFQASLQHKRAR